ncbi:hypothetical protein [Catellatospora chokoriensis]|nr:hypothetical protein [Catellatospora chokoriensis]
MKVHPLGRPPKATEAMVVLVGSDVAWRFRTINAITLLTWRVLLPLAPALTFAVAMIGGISGSITGWALFAALVATSLTWWLPMVLLHYLACDQYPRAWHGGTVVLRRVDAGSAHTWQQLNGADMVKVENLA